MVNDKKLTFIIVVANSGSLKFLFHYDLVYTEWKTEVDKSRKKSF